MDKKDFQSQKDKLQKRIIYDVDIFKTRVNYNNVIESLLEDTENIALSILFPFEDFSLIQLPKRYYNWQIRASIELYNMAGRTDIASYTENGLSWTKFKSGLSKDLLNELVAKVGIPKKIIESEA